MEAAVSLAAIEFDGEVKWPSGAVIRTVDEGVGLSRMWFEIASGRGIALRYRTGAQRLVQDRSGRISGVVVRDRDGISQLDAGSVVLACGGFEANPEWRARYLQRPWDMAKVRGTAYNTGDGLHMALELGALPFGQWSGNHGTPIDADAPPFGDRQLTDKTNRLSYPLGVMVNTDGDRFIDEGEDFQLYTYAKTGGAILQQPGNVAYQIFDAKVTSLLEPRYGTGDPLVADTLDELIHKLPVGKTRLKESLIAYNAAVGVVPFDPTVRDGLDTKGLTPEKSNWAQALDTPPFRAYPVTGGITFTFGGLRIDQNAQVLASDWTPIEGLYTCGEMVGGLFHHNYPGGSGLTSGAVFGRIAGRAAAESARP
jgi:tricarballylate dehydrogenase